MRVLLDESMPKRVGRVLRGHEVRTATQMGWRGLKNGALLRQAVADGFTALVTADRSIEYQQNVARIGLGVVVLIAPSNRLIDHEPLAPGVMEALLTLRTGQIVHVGTRRRA